MCVTCVCVYYRLGWLPIGANRLPVGANNGRTQVVLARTVNITLVHVCILACVYGICVSLCPRLHTLVWVTYVCMPCVCDMCV